jgi:DNA-binding NarL/FixJ family response regulator
MLRVLIIDDSKVLRKMMVATLEREITDCRVQEYDPVIQGFPGRDFQWSDFDIVFLDHNLGLNGEDGLGWLKKFCTFKGMPPVVMLTEEERPSVIVHAMKLGAKNYLLKKDLKSIQLDAVIDDALGRTCTVSADGDLASTWGDGGDQPQRLDADLPVAERSDSLIVVRRDQTTVAKVVAAGPLNVPGYRIISQIAKGGMTTIFLAERAEDDLRVVLKLLFTRGDKDQQVLKYFMQEYALISRIDHPYIIKIFERAFAKDFAYIALEYLPAGDLATRIGKGLTPDRAVPYVGQIAQALSAVHERGIVHRDLKPGNILFRHNDTVAISDFGVAYVAQASSGLEESNAFIGTPIYMSPEQCEGRTVDQRSDLYSLGIIFFEMLTGRRPYVATSVAMMIDAHLHAPIPRLPGEVAKYQPLVDGLLAKDVSERFQSADEFFAGLEWIE